MLKENRENHENVGVQLSKGGFDIRSAIISTMGKVLHIMISSGDKSLENTSKKFLDKTSISTHIDTESGTELENFKNNNKGIIILTHKSGIFSDYLPIFEKLGDKILKKSTFYTGAYNIEMNKREFPDYNFRKATLDKKEDVIELNSGIEEEVNKVIKEGGYIFIIPSGANLDKNGEFKGIFQRMVKKLPDDFPILASNIEHQGNVGYFEIGKKLIGLGEKSISNISFKSLKNNDFKNKDGKKMRDFYNSLFVKKD